LKVKCRRPCKYAAWGFNDHPLVDGDRLICTPGAKDATLVALNKFSGEVIWKAVVPQGDTAAHSPVVVVEVDGIRQYVELLTGKRLYVRDQNILLCYDLRADRPPPPVPEKPAPAKQASRLPDAIFIASPQDVVEKMLELAKVTKADLVVDLGWGDGRIPVTAAKQYAGGFNLQFCPNRRPITEPAES
jgi:hypothetical protein